MALSDRDFLTQMIACDRACMSVARQYLMDNPDGAMEDDAEECFECCAGEVALYELMLEMMPAGEDSMPPENKIRREALEWKRMNAERPFPGEPSKKHTP